MQKALISVAAIACYAICHVAWADITVQDKGAWPKSWPAELEPLRKQSRTTEGPLGNFRYYAIRFTTREEFEAAWPHLLKVKGKDTYLVLTRGANVHLGDEAKAGVVFHGPPLDNPAAADKGREQKHPSAINLVVDGEIIDLNRIPLPPDTPISDQRFREAAAGKNK